MVLPPNLNIENMLSKNSALRAAALFLGLSLWGCGDEKGEGKMRENSRQTEIVATLLFPEHLSEGEKNNLKEKIAIYCFQFYGDFPERGHQSERDDIDAKKFSQHLFLDLPFDEHLKIMVWAFDQTHQISYCRGETEISYFEGKKDRVMIPLKCS